LIVGQLLRWWIRLGRDYKESMAKVNLDAILMKELDLIQKWDLIKEVDLIVLMRK
jgi:hypothetical protein